MPQIMQSSPYRGDILGIKIIFLLIWQYLQMCYFKVEYINTIANSDLNRPCFAWHPYEKSGLFKTELVIVHVLVLASIEGILHSEK